MNGRLRNLVSSILLGPHSGNGMCSSLRSPKWTGSILEQVFFLVSVVDHSDANLCKNKCSGKGSNSFSNSLIKSSSFLAWSSPAFSLLISCATSSRLIHLTAVSLLMEFRLCNFFVTPQSILFIYLFIYLKAFI